EQIVLDTAVQVVRRKPFGGPLVVRIGAGTAAHEFDVPDSIASSLWVRSDAPHEGCTLESA
ncbi:MAG: ferrous iron transport protein A, partial [Sinomonas sp.]|nr:ferrous iron transport protein A [Sinomonas sp.]